MSLLIIFAYVALSALTIFLMVKPFLGTREEQVRTELLDEEVRRIEHLVAQKRMLVNALRDLEFEFETSKITETDYKRFRQRYERRAVGVMRELDAIHGGRGWEDRINAEIQSRLGVESPEAPEPEDSHAPEADEAASEHPVQEVLEVSKQDASAMADLVCAKCGTELEPDDKFCGQCGATVSSGEEVSA